MKHLAMYKKRSKWAISLVAGVALLMAGLVNAGPASATSTPLSNTSLTLATLGSLFDFTAGGTMDSSYDFPISGILPSNGSVHSEWRPGKGALTGDILYLYQINVTSYDVSGITIPFNNLQIPSGISSLYCSDCGGTVAPTLIAYDDLGTPSQADDLLRVSYFGGGLNTLGLGFGQVGPSSFKFGAISTAPPTVVTANLLDTGTEVSPNVFAPVPEPSTLLLLGSGLAGTGFWFRRRKK